MGPVQCAVEPAGSRAAGRACGGCGLVEGDSGQVDPESPVVWDVSRKGTAAGRMWVNSRGAVGLEALLGQRRDGVL